MKTKRAIPLIFLALLLAGLATGCNTPAQLSSTAASPTATPAPTESPATWEIVRQFEVEQRTNIAGFHDEDFGITVGYAGIVYYTVDGGETWTRSNNTSMCRFGLDIVDESVAWHVGNGGQVRVSTDGGQNWEGVSDLSDRGISSSISFLDTKTGWTASLEELWATSDGGQTWVDVTLPNSELLIAAVTLRTATDAYVLGYTGKFHTTHDGGKTWTSQALELGEDKIDVSAQPAVRFFDAENGVIATKLLKKGIVALRTADGGETWVRENVLDDAALSQSHLYLSRDGKLLTVYVPTGKTITVLSYNG
ncbi:MAG: hypothetical protein JXA14_20070 [Anaerolineae bacterium]|nr:hypothetical protein [Anaerolineae bacterium]